MSAINTKITKDTKTTKSYLKNYNSHLRDLRELFSRAPEAWGLRPETGAWTLEPGA